jgi:hypothetical protein
MRRNLIVLGGVAILMVAGYFAPALSFPEKKWYMDTMETMSVTSGASMAVGFIILWFMQTTSKWRGVLWIVLSVVGPILTIKEVQWSYEFFSTRPLPIDPSYVSGEPSYEIGLYLIFLGYLIVIIGSVWDLRQKWREEEVNTIPSQTVSQGNVEQ